jgi:hypothetical protein
MLRRTLLYGFCSVPQILRAVDPRTARRFEPAIFSTATVYNLAGLRPEDAVLARLMRAIRPPVLRVPAGNTMNLWDWNAGAVRTADQVLKFGADPKHRLYIGPIGGRARYLREMGGPMLAERWAQLAREGGAEPLWGLNVSTMAPEENRTFLQHLKSAGLPAHRFELGNEIYHANNWGKEVPTVQDYIRKAKAHAKEVKAVFPDARVAVCVNANDDRVNGPLVKAAPSEFKPAPLSQWNSALRKESFYDAVVIHLYFKSEEFKDLEGVSADDFIRWAAVRSSAFCIGEILAWPERVFAGKEVWATEWNLNNRTYKLSKPGQAQNYRFLPEHTLLSGLFTASFLLNAASVPSNLTIANYWQLNGGPDFGMISDAPYKERPAFHVFRMLAPAVHECDHIAQWPLPEAPRVRGPRQFRVMQAPAVTGFAFLKGDQTRYLAFLNFTEKEFPVRLQAPANGKLDCLTGAELLPSWNNPANPQPSKWFPKYELRQSEVRRDALTLMPRSFTVVSLS